MFCFKGRPEGRGNRLRPRGASRVLQRQLVQAHDRVNATGVVSILLELFCKTLRATEAAQASRLHLNVISISSRMATDPSL
ncbi:hypothetical protein EYF80_027349 [Liparis tanakae]|uniref:Uncharacterized protein n=1 Tax=Liparis tanakae TaxID=230148 RepID=A0A4Z2HA12_9TELE|nr:hypothetical protein EYF80_027349 [Liparis tanakae]